MLYQIRDQFCSIGVTSCVVGRFDRRKVVGCTTIGHRGGMEGAGKRDIT
jgi:hypothetical protein